MAEGKATLAGLQHVLITAQADAHSHRRRQCSHCKAPRPLKDHRTHRLVSLFGVVEVRAPRFGPCRCGVACRRSLTPVAEIMPDRCTPEYERVLAGMGGALPYRRARALLAELLPLDTPPEVETIRRRTLQVRARLERAALVPPDRGTPGAGRHGADDDVGQHRVPDALAALAWPDRAGAGRDRRHPGRPRRPLGRRR